MMKHVVPVVVLLICSPLAAQQSPRMTRTVKLIQQVEGGVAAIFTRTPDGGMGGGSGSVIHSQGFILTNDHVVRDLPGVVLLKDLPPMPYRLVGRLPEKDLAVIQVPTPRPLTPIPLGRSHDMLSGEPILVGGNPGGRGIVFTAGIVSSPSFMIDAPNALVMAMLKADVRDRFIQFDAASNQGNSGGPLINAEGFQVGVVSGKNLNEENINFAVPVDRVRQQFAAMIAPEIRGGFVTGVTVDTMTEQAVVTGVAADSPAARADLQVGDVLLAVDGAPLRSGMDWLLKLAFRKPGQTLAVTFQRGDHQSSGELLLGEYPLPEPLPAEGKQPGLRYATYHGEFERLPDFAALEPVERGMADSLSIEDHAAGRDDSYALVYEGYLKIAATGVYRLILASDDGSRLYLHDELLIDNDGAHPTREVGRLVRLPEGLHPIRLNYFEATGDAELKFAIHPDGQPRTEVTPDMLFRDAEESKQPSE